MENVKAIIAKNLVELRKSKRMTQQELAEKLNYSDKAISRWEHAETLPDIETLCRICDIYGVSFEYLLSKDAQGLCAEVKENLPVNQPVLLDHLQKKYFLTEKASSGIIQNLFLRKSYDNRKNMISDLLGIYLRTELKDLLSGTLSIDDFMKTMDEKYEILKYRANARIKNAI